MKKPKKPGKKTERIDLRLTEKEKNRIQLLADRFAGGNINLWCVYAALECPRIYLVAPTKEQK